MKRILRLCLLAVSLSATADPLTTRFSYQGSLAEAGSPAEGLYDFRLAVHDAAMGGTPRLAATELPSVDVHNGAFTVTLDYPTAFSGERRWLDVAVRRAGSGADYTTLTPRQEILPTPYSLYSLQAATAGSVRWQDIQGVPPALADGDDVGHYTAGLGLTLASGSFKIADHGVVGTMIADNTIPAGKLSGFGVSAGQVLQFDGRGWAAATLAVDGVRSLNGLTGDLNLIAGANVTLSPAKGGWEISATGGGESGWSLTGNTVGKGAFLGTLNDYPIEFRAAGSVVFRMVGSPAGDSPNLIGGHPANSIAPGTRGGTIAGGGSLEANVIQSGDYATISGGLANRVDGLGDTVSGGYQNSAASTSSTVSGGFQNVAERDSSVVAGGFNNQASGVQSSVGGGSGNLATGASSTVPGGSRNEARGRSSFAAGSGARALHDGTFVWSDTHLPDGEFASTGPDQFCISAHGGLQMSPGTSAFFGSEVRQMLNLWGEQYGIGVQANTAYFRTGSRFSWFAGGDHQDFENSPGKGGTVLMTLNSGGLTVNGTLVSASDRNLKGQFRSVDPQLILDQVLTLPLSEWEYKADGEHARHLGPMSQDFRAAFGLGTDDLHIATVDADGVSLAAIQGLHQRLQDELKHKDARINELEARILHLESVLGGLPSK